MNRNFTKDEAQRIFSLAAERQQAKQKEENDLLTITDLEEAGLAAGIDPAFIRAAASDLLRPDRITEQRTFIGIPVEFRESHVLPLAFNEANWKKSVDIFSRVYDRSGHIREVGTTKRWSSEKNENQMPANIIAEKEEDGTRFTIQRNTWPMTLGFGIGAVVNLMIGLIFTAIWLTHPEGADLAIPAGIMTGVGILLGLFGTVGLKIYSKQELERFAKVFSHLDNLASNDTLSGRTASTTSQLDDPGQQEMESRISLDDLEVPDAASRPTQQSKNRL